MKNILVGLLLLFCFESVGQNSLFSSEPEKFVADIEKYFQKQLGATTQAATAEFNRDFAQKMNENERGQVIGLFQKLGKKNFQASQYFLVVDLYRGFQRCSTLKEKNYTLFTQYLANIIDQNGSKRYFEILLGLQSFFSKQLVYSSSFSKVYLLGADFHLGFSKDKIDFFNPISEPKSSLPNSVEEDLGWGEQTNLAEYDPWLDPKLERVRSGVDTVSKSSELPQISGLFITFSAANLALVTASDSICVTNTEGAYDFQNTTFVGKNGQIRWQVGQDSASASLKYYSFHVQKSKLLAQEVSLALPSRLNKPVLGILELKLEKRGMGQANTYPRFKSYQNNAQLLLPLQNYSYIGGFSLMGPRISTASIAEGYTQLVVNKGARNMFTVESRNFVINDSLITSERVSFVTKFDKDSVSHPAVKMQYDLKANQLHLNKLDKGGFRNSMYADTFHQVDIKCDAMSWDLDGAKMNFYIVAGKTEIPAVFESFDYFNPDRIRALSTFAGYNPLILGGNLISKKKKNSITIDEMVQATKKEVHIVANGMLIANQMGFFDFNPNTGTYALSRKGEHYYLSYFGKKDFDDLVLSSMASNKKNTGNASIDLNSKSLDIQGTQDFKLSDSLGISFIPKDQSMQIVGNKVFTFAGEIVVKNFRFFGDFEVQYENFLVKLNRIDSIRFVPIELYRKGSRQEIGGHVQYGKTGILYLNSPDNKSGRKVLAAYPKLEIPAGMITYFNESTRREKFDQTVYFKTNVLKIDSLNVVDPVFEGTFVSGSIFKPILEKLVVMPDTSLGFLHKPKIPYPLYGTASTLKTNTDIVFNKSGLQASGEINHLTSKLLANQIHLSPIGLTAKGESGKISEQFLPNMPYFPSVSVPKYALVWHPFADSMAIQSEVGFSFYAGSSILKGKLILRKQGLFGNGTLERIDSETQSMAFTFNKNGFTAQEAAFRIKSNEKETKPVFTGKNVGVDFSTLASSVKISPENKDFGQEFSSSQLEFPYTSYITTIDNAVWDIKAQKIDMKGSLENSIFRSTQANQFGLSFNGTAASYDIANLKLNISGVEKINSADAYIVPYKGKVSVQKEGFLETFTQASIIADTANQYHTLTQAEVKINSRISFSGNANYRFVNVSADTFNIKLGNFEFAEIGKNGEILDNKSSNRLSTIARAKVTEKDGIFLSTKMLYRGQMTMLAPFKNLTFNGSVLPDLKQYPMLGGNWINYNGSKSEEININVDETLKDGGKPLYVGLHLKNGVQTDAIYPTFLSAKKNGDDADIFNVKGVFKRDEVHKRFVVDSPNPDEISNRFEFYDEKGLIAMDGKFDLLGAPSRVFETVGVANLSLDSLKYVWSVLMKFDFPISIPSTQKWGQNVVKFNLDAGNSDPAIHANDPLFQAKLRHFVGLKEAAAYPEKSAASHLPLFKYSPKFLNTLVLSDVSLRWNPVANSYYSVGKLGISNIGDVDINAMTDGYLEVTKSPLTGDEINIFIEISPANWYYLSYKAGQLSLTSSDEEINKLIATPSLGKDKKNEVVFVDMADAAKFRKRFLQQYHGIKEAEIAKKPSTNPLVPGQLKPKAPTTKEDEKDGF
jgi:hypothetical protein